MSDTPNPLPIWMTQEELGTAPHLMSQWLFDQQSLTRRLSALSNNGFSVQPLQQGTETLRDEECHALALAKGSLGFVREVYLCGNQTPWVFARSVASTYALSQSGIELTRLGERSLGELLFSDPGFTRGPLSACHYPAHWLPQAVQSDNLWARRSRFTQGTLAILVTEVFLPSFWQQLTSDQ